MDFGKVEYLVFQGGDVSRTLRLTLVGQGDDDVLRAEGLAGLRRKRIVRLTSEAERQRCLLSYEDLSWLLLSSFATLKRDVQHLERTGNKVPLKGRRRTGGEGEHALRVANAE